MNRIYQILLGIFVLPALLLAGCAGDGADKPAGSVSGEPAGSVSGSEAAGGAISGVEPSAEPIAFEGTDLEGNAVTADVFSQSKLTMVNVWATYCGPCLNEMPYLGELASEYEAEEFQIIGIVSDVMEGKDQSLAESLVEQTGADYPHLTLNESIYYGLLMDVTAVPTTFFVDKDGMVLDVVVGAMKKTAWEEKINGLLESL